MQRQVLGLLLELYLKKAAPCFTGFVFFFSFGNGVGIFDPITQPLFQHTDVLHHLIASHYCQSALAFTALKSNLLDSVPSGITRHRYYAVVYRLASPH